MMALRLKALLSTNIRHYRYEILIVVSADYRDTSRGRSRIAVEMMASKRGRANLRVVPSDLR